MPGLPLHCNLESGAACNFFSVNKLQVSVSWRALDTDSWIELGLVDEAKAVVEKWMARWIDVVSQLSSSSSLTKVTDITVVKGSHPPRSKRGIVPMVPRNCFAQLAVLTAYVSY
jgi:hypothetical protein